MRSLRRTETEGTVVNGSIRELQRTRNWADISTFANLPAASRGKIAVVTDSSTATWGATIAGGGANVVLAWHNGTNWTVIGV
jgi:hypothetical protein